MEPTQELRRLKEFMKEVGTQLSILEKHLYEFETEYLETTAGYGNLVAGFEGFQDRCTRVSWASRACNIPYTHCLHLRKIDAATPGAWVLLSRLLLLCFSGWSACGFIRSVRFIVYCIYMI